MKCLAALLPLYSDIEHRKGEFRLLLHLQNFKGKKTQSQKLYQQMKCIYIYKVSCKSEAKSLQLTKCWLKYINFFLQNKISDSNFPCIQVQDFVFKGIKARANMSLAGYCPILCTALTWDETCAGGYLGIPLKWLFLHWWLSWLRFAGGTEGIRFQVSKNFSWMRVPNSLGLIFSYMHKV